VKYTFRSNNKTFSSTAYPTS